MCGRNMVSISAGKYWTSAVTATGDVYMWDGKKGKDKPLIATRMHGVKKATSVSVGETHLLIVASLYHPVYPIDTIDNSQKFKLNSRNSMEELNEDILFEDSDSHNTTYTVQNDNLRQRSTPSLKSLCEKVAAESLLEPRNAIQLLEIADSLGADDLKKYCEVRITNLDRHKKCLQRLHIIFYYISSFELCSIPCTRTGQVYQRNVDTCPHKDINLTSLHLKNVA
jgi:hypothetical protein